LRWVQVQGRRGAGHRPAVVEEAAQGLPQPGTAIVVGQRPQRPGHRRCRERIVGQLGEHRELTQLRPDANFGETRHATGSPRRELGLPV
jgi:hypothetical protein